MKRIIITLLGCTLASSNSAFAETVLFKAYNKLASIELPRGMCDITASQEGQLVSSWLAERLRSSSLQNMPSLEVVFGNCSGMTDGYPWGWIGVYQGDATGLTQAIMNAYFKENLGGLIAETEGKLDAKTARETFEQATGFSIEKLSVGVPVTLASNDDLYLHSLAQTSSLNGELVSEIILTAAMLRNGTMIYTYAYEEQKNPESVLELAQELKRISKTLNVR